jgi:hypothetical protein
MSGLIHSTTTMSKQPMNRRRLQSITDSSLLSSKALKDSDILVQMQQYVKTKYEPHEEEMMNKILLERDTLLLQFEEENNRELQQFINFMETSSILQPPSPKAPPPPKEARYSCICADSSTLDVKNQYIHSVSCKRYREMCEKINNSLAPSRQDHAMMQAIDSFASTQMKAIQRFQNGIFRHKKRQEKEFTFKPSINHMSKKLYEEMIRTGRLERKPVRDANKKDKAQKDQTFIPTISKRSQEIISEKRLQAKHVSTGVITQKKSPSNKILWQVSSQPPDHYQSEMTPPPLNTVTIGTTTNCNFILQSFIQSN